MIFKDSNQLEIDWVEMHIHALGIAALAKSGKRRVSFVDQMSFLIMKRRNLTTAFAFDPHFKTEGFRLFHI